FDRVRREFARVVTRDLVAVAGGPDDVRIAGIGQRMPGFAAAQAVIPLQRAGWLPAVGDRFCRGLLRAAGSKADTSRRSVHFRQLRQQGRIAGLVEAAVAFGAWPAVAGQGRVVGAGDEVTQRQQAIAAGLGQRAWPAHGEEVLAVAVDPVRHLVVGGDVVVLPDRQDHVDGIAGAGGDAGAAIAGDDVVGRIGRIDPHVVAIAATCRAHGLGVAAVAAEGAPTVSGKVRTAVGDVDVVGVLGVDRDADVVAGAAGERTVGAGEFPALAVIVRAPQRTLVEGLDQGVDPLWIGWGDGHVDLAQGRFRQALVQPGPGHAVVARGEYAAARTAAVLLPGALGDLPGAGKEYVRVVRVHAQAGAAGILVDEQRAFPGLAAVGGAEHAALLLRRRSTPQRAHEHVVGIARVDHDARDASGFRQAHVLPVLAGIGGLVHAVTDHVAWTDHPWLAGTHPDRIGIGRRDRKRADRRHVLVVEDGDVGVAAIGGLPQAARCRAQVIRGVVAGDADGGRDAPARRRAHVVELQRGDCRGALQVRRPGGVLCVGGG